MVQEGLEKGLIDYGKLPSVDVERDEETVWTTGIDWIQENLECCGITDGYDWSRNAGAATWWISITGGNHINDTPDSCCVTISEKCGVGMAVQGVQSTVHEDGCFSFVKNWVEDKSNLMGICGLIFIVVEIFNIIIACVLRRSIMA